MEQKMTKSCTWRALVNFLVSCTLTMQNLTLMFGHVEYYMYMQLYEMTVIKLRSHSVWVSVKRMLTHIFLEEKQTDRGKRQFSSFKWRNERKSLFPALKWKPRAPLCIETSYSAISVVIKGIIVVFSLRNENQWAKVKKTTPWRILSPNLFHLSILIT